MKKTSFAHDSNFYQLVGSASNYSYQIKLLSVNVYIEAFAQMWFSSKLTVIAITLK